MTNYADTPIYDSMPNKRKIERIMSKPKWDFQDANRKALAAIRKQQREDANTK